MIVAGVLGVMAVLSLCFLTLARLERKASQQRLHGTRAFLLARSGLEDFLARTSAGQDPESTLSRYGGEDWNANGLLDPAEASAETFAPGVLDLDACPLSQAMRPSFPVRNTFGPLLRPMDGRSRGYSGSLAGNVQTYALKTGVGGFHVNGGDPAQPSGTGYNAMLRRMLGILAREIGGAVTQADGEGLVTLRPARGWSSYVEIRQRALGGSQAKLEALKPYIALTAWTDKRVIAPNATEAMLNRAYSSWGDLKLDRANPADPSSRAPDFERMPRVAGGKVVGRAPVELTWARTRRPALTALLEGLRGLYLDEGAALLSLNDYTYETSPWTAYATSTAGATTPR